VKFHAIKSAGGSQPVNGGAERSETVYGGKQEGGLTAGRAPGPFPKASGRANR